jgi:hypothetical protein
MLLGTDPIPLDPTLQLAVTLPLEFSKFFALVVIKVRSGKNEWILLG